MFILSQQLNAFLTVKRGIEEEISRNQSGFLGGSPADWLLLTRPIHFVFDGSLRYDWSSLRCLTAKHRNASPRLAHVYRLYELLASMVEMHA